MLWRTHMCARSADRLRRSIFISCWGLDPRQGSNRLPSDAHKAHFRRHSKKARKAPWRPMLPGRSSPDSWKVLKKCKQFVNAEYFSEAAAAGNILSQRAPWSFGQAAVATEETVCASPMICETWSPQACIAARTCISIRADPE